MPAWVEDPFAATIVSAFDGAIAATYTPGATWSGPAQRVVVARGTAPSLRFSPADGPQAIFGSEYEVRVGVLGTGECNSYTVADGNLDVDEATGDFDVLWTVDEINAIPFLQTVAADVFRSITPGTRAHVGRVLLQFTETHYGE